MRSARTRRSDRRTSTVTTADHPFGAHPRIEIASADVTECERRFAQRRAFVMRLLRDCRGLVVADVRRERGDEHQRAADKLADARPVGLDSTRAVRFEA